VARTLRVCLLGVAIAMLLLLCAPRQLAADGLVPWVVSGSSSCPQQTCSSSTLRVAYGGGGAEVVHYTISATGDFAYQFDAPESASLVAYQVAGGAGTYSLSRLDVTKGELGGQ
jgi:hypothetical protein